MTSKQHSYRISLITLILAIASLSAYAAEPLDSLPEGTLQKGMTYHQVLKRWGSPEARFEYETARKERWKYPDAEVVFLEGKVMSWKASDRSSRHWHHRVEHPNPQPPTTPPKEQQNDIEAILSEIMQGPP